MSKSSHHQLRIIGGQWRSRRLRFAAEEGCRPTLNRVRETLFNWLQNEVEGAVVLDAFAGSGALGLEALSRSAQSVVFLERNPAVALQLKSNLELLHAANAQVWAGDALTYMEQNPHPYDLVFLDPPFHQGLLEPAIERLALAPGATVYMEHEVGLNPKVPDNWHQYRHKSTKEFEFSLYDVGE